MRLDKEEDIQKNAKETLLQIEKECKPASSSQRESRQGMFL